MGVYSGMITERLWRICSLATLLLLLILFLSHTHDGTNIVVLQSLLSTAYEQSLPEPKKLGKLVPPPPSPSYSPPPRPSQGELLPTTNKLYSYTEPKNSTESNSSSSPPVHDELPKNATSEVIIASPPTPTYDMINSTFSLPNEECNLFDGNWVYDPEASPLYDPTRCPFLSEQVSCQGNGRPDSEYQKWRWEPKGCRSIIPGFNVGKSILERLRGKRAIIVGDSINRNQWESFACLLYSADSPNKAQVQAKSDAHKVFWSEAYNCTVEFYWSPFLVQLNGNRRGETGKRILKLNQISSSAKNWYGADIMVFNSGHWWEHGKEIRAWDLFDNEGKLVDEMEIGSAVKTAFTTWANWIEQNVDRNKTRVFFRSISPEHKNEVACLNQTAPSAEAKATLFPPKIQEAIESTIREMKTPVVYLNITVLSQYRRDGHPSFFARKLSLRPDCSHWCLPGVPDTWNMLVYASMLLLDISTDVATLSLVGSSSSFS